MTVKIYTRGCDVRPGEVNRTRLIAGGGGALVVGAILYGVAAATAGTMADATTSEELTSTRSTANLLVMTSGALGAVGLGVGAAAFLLPNQGGVRFNVRF